MPGQRHLSAFWSAYRQTHPTHRVFVDHSDSLSTVIPLAVHGDEGRGVRKGNTCLLTLESPFGLGTAANVSAGNHYCGCNGCQSGGVNMDEPVLSSSANNDIAGMQEHNVKGHCFLTKFLVFLLPHALYKASDLWLALLEQVCKELRQLFFEGVYAGGRYWHAAVIGCKGDMAYFVKIANLTRCYTRLAEDACMCHECLAGSRSQPFEDCSERPSWAQSLYARRPWDDTPVISAIPFDSTPERMLRRDVFHNTKIGVFRDLVGSAVVLIAELGYFSDDQGSNSMKFLLQRAHSHFRLYCLAIKKPAALHSFSKENFSAPTRKAFPWVRSKGSDTTLLVDWLVALCTALLATPLDPAHVPVISLIKQTAQAASNFMKSMYRHGLWLTRRCAEAVYAEGRRFLEGCNELAYTSLHRLRFNGFGMKPKLHMVAHTTWDLKRWLDDASVTLIPSPLMWCCEPNEDMVGRMSRIARRSHQARVCERSLEKYLIKTRALYRRYKKNPELSLKRKR